MEIASLLWVCVTAFLVVFLVLTVLAFFMRIIIHLFPEKNNNEDSLTAAVISAVMNANYPGRKISGIREEK
jgi:hypothetical protein